jgi:DNA polymerase-3 subunit alpha (Gram-positive type)
MCRELSELKFIVFDVETTGLEPELGDRIIEIGAVKVDRGKTVDRFSSLVNPHVAISSGAFEVNRITQDMLKSAPSPSEILPKFMDFIRGNILFAYNANFDIGFIRQELNILKYPFPQDLLIIDILSMAKSLLPNSGSYSLNSVARYFDIVSEQKHRALEDAEVSFKVLERLFNILKNRGMDDFSYVKNTFSINKEVIEKAIADKISEIQEAINLGVKVKLKYFSSFNGEVSEREVTPRRIMKENNKDYLVGYCHLRGDERTFRIDGILHIEILSDKIKY